MSLRQLPDANPGKVAACKLEPSCVPRSDAHRCISSNAQAPSIRTPIHRHALLHSESLLRTKARVDSSCRRQQGDTGRPVIGVPIPRDPDRCTLRNSHSLHGAMGVAKLYGTQGSTKSSQGGTTSSATRIGPPNRKLPPLKDIITMSPCNDIVGPIGHSHGHLRVVPPIILAPIGPSQELCNASTASQLPFPEEFFPTEDAPPAVRSSLEKLHSTRMMTAAALMLLSPL